MADTVLDDTRDDVQTVDIIVAHGTDKHKFALPISSQVASLHEEIERATGVPQNAQKLLFKGKTLTNPKQTLKDLKIKRKAKMLLIGKKEDPIVEKCSNEFVKIRKNINKYSTELSELEQSWQDIIQGHLPEDYCATSAKKLQKGVLAINEYNVRLLEQMDNMPIHEDMKQLRTTRKILIADIEKLLERGDLLLENFKESNLTKRA